MNMMEKLSRNQDKNSKKKRTNEGTTINSSNSFSILGHDDIIDKGIHMGVNLGSCDYESIDMLKDLENARLALHEKMKATVTSDSNTDKCMNLSQNEHEDDINLLDWMEEGKSKEDDFVLITPKRHRKSVQKLILSGKKQNKGRNKENPCMQQKKGQADMGNPISAPYPS
jgi:hypothetical protein